MNLQCDETDCVFEEQADTRVPCGPTGLVDASGVLGLGFPTYVMARRAMGESTACLVRAFGREAVGPAARFLFVSLSVLFPESTASAQFAALGSAATFLLANAEVPCRSANMEAGSQRRGEQCGTAM